jgi:hypothetical protein
MLRVFKVTSPMSVGSWILFVSGGASTTAAVLEKAGRLRRMKLAAETVSALAGGPLATYTGGLFADTAVPVWHEARRELPYLFGSSAAASAGAASTLFLDPRDAGPARRLAVGAAVAELGIARRMETQLGPFLAEPYKQGPAGVLTRASKSLVAVGAGILALRGKQSRRAAVAGSSVLLAGELMLRFAVWQAGKQSARDPKYTVEPQRARVAARGAEEAGAGEGTAPRDAVRSGALVGPGTRT